MWHHPKYYEELRKKRKELEASLDPESEDQAPSTKHQAASSLKRQASSHKHQASSIKQR
jgi:U3 small nucleolar RNA-associated protein 14